MPSTSFNTDSNIFHKIDESAANDIINLGRIREIKPKGVLFEEGTPATHCFFIQDGHLKISKTDMDGNETIVRYANPGQITAAISIIQQQTYPATASAVDSATVIEWDKDSLLKAIHRIPQLAINIMGLMAARIGELQDRYQELNHERTDSRIAKALLRLVEQAGCQTKDGITIDFAIGRQDLASFAGTTQFTFSRTISKWEKQGWLLTGREQVTVVSIEDIVRVAEQT